MYVSFLAPVQSNTNARTMVACLYARAAADCVALPTAHRRTALSLAIKRCLTANNNATALRLVRQLLPLIEEKSPLADQYHEVRRTLWVPFVLVVACLFVTSCTHVTNWFCSLLQTEQKLLSLPQLDDALMQRFLVPPVGLSLGGVRLLLRLR